jgi:anthranilate phosphoribosyltransferase
VLALHDDEVTTFTVDPVELGFAPAIADELVGGDAGENAEVVRRVLGGEHGAHRNIVVLNAAAGLVVAGMVDDIEAGVAAAQVAIDSGAAAATLEKVIEASQTAAAAHG